jgi:hypothetical protein
MNRKAILKDRAKYYGPATLGFFSFGAMVRAIIQEHYQILLPHDLPPHVGALLMANIKLMRACRPAKFRLDNYDDAVNYVDIALEATRDGLKTQRRYSVSSGNRREKVGVRKRTD